MKILRAGFPQKDEIGTGTCISCGCQIEAARHECIDHPGYDQLEGPWYEYPCPTKGCNGKISVHDFKKPKISLQPRDA